MFDADQADGLRHLFARERPEVIVACGGAPTQAQIVADLGVGLARQGTSVLVIDGSAGGVAQALGRGARYELGHVIAGDKKLSQVIVEGAPNLRVLPAMRGLEQLWRLSHDQARALKNQFSHQLASIETLVVNCGPLGSVAACRAFQGGAHVVLILTERPDSMTAAYREIKSLWTNCGITECDVIVSDPGVRARARFASLADTARRFLGVRLNLQGNLSPNASHAGPTQVGQLHALSDLAAHEPQTKGRPDVHSHRGGPPRERLSLRPRIHQENAHAAVG